MAKPRSILILNRTFPPAFGATGRMACDLALHLRHQGHKITIITTAENAKIDSAKNLKIIRIQASQKPKSIWNYLKILWAMKREASQLPNHDIVVSMTDPPLQVWAGNKIARKMKAKHIHWAMDVYPDLLPVIGTKIHPLIYNFVKNKIYKVMKRTDKIIVISKCMARYMAHQSISKSGMMIVENWADKYLQEDIGQPEQSLLDDKKFRILYAGTIGLAHDFNAVFKAAKCFQNHYPDIEFIVTNRGGGAYDFNEKIKMHGLKNIRMMPPQPSKKLKSLMASGDVHLITMKDDAIGKLFPSKFYSAMASGRPAIFVGPEKCDLYDKIITHELGQSVRNDDPKAFVQSILKYYNDGQLWFDHCANASKFSQNHAPLKQWEKIIVSL